MKFPPKIGHGATALLLDGDGRPWINNSVIVNALKQVSDRRDCEIFSRISCRLEHTTNITLLEVHCHWSLPDNKYEWVRLQ